MKRSKTSDHPDFRVRRIRQSSNWVNLSTPLGFALSALSGARPRRTDDGLYLATNYAWPVPIAGAFTVGDVVFTRGRRISADPISPLSQSVWRHETMHANQYAWCLGLPFLPAYVAACGYSYLMCGDFWSYNVFETRADLSAGGYRKAPRRTWISRLRQPE